MPIKVGGWELGCCRYNMAKTGLQHGYTTGLQQGHNRATTWSQQGYSMAIRRHY